MTKIVSRTAAFALTLAALAGTPVAAQSDPIRAQVQSEMPALMTIYRDLHQHPELSFQEVRSAKVMADAARKAGAQVLLVGMRMPPNFGPDFTARYEKAFRDLARTNTLRFVPFLMDGFADQPAFFQPDGLHPVASAQPRILETVWKELKPLLH